VAVAALALTLVLTDAFSPRGVVFGSFQECGLCPAQEATGMHPQRGALITFIRIGSNRQYPVITDSMGNYSVSLPEGHYLIRAFYLVGPHEVTVVAGKRFEANFVE
jgi:hypothetical protein